MERSERRYGETPEGARVDEHTIRNGRGLEIRVITWGAILTSVRTPDRRGRMANVVLGFDSLEPYLANPSYFGAVIGRFANRIGRGSLTLDGVHYQLACNDGPHHAHGGVRGFDKVIWKAEGFDAPGAAGTPPAPPLAAAAGVRLTYRSHDGEEGYPGNLEVTVAYSLNEAGELAIEYRAEADRPTTVNLTNHAYWNLAGAGSGDVLAQELVLDCPWYLPADDTLLPTGEIRGVEGTPFDFRRPKPIGRDIAGVPHGPAVPPGYDHCLAFEAESRAPRTALPVPQTEPGREPRLHRLGRALDPASGRGMEVSTTMPGVQLYTGNFLDGERGAGGAVYRRHDAFCLETQFFPDSPNRPQFPSPILRPGQVWRQRTVHRFYTE